MSARLKKIRALGREKMAMYWPEMKKPDVGRIHDRLASDQQRSVLFSRPRDPARSTGQRTD